MQNTIKIVMDNKIRVLLGLLTIVLIGTLINNYNKGDILSSDKYVVKTGNITEVVEVSGQVEAGNDIALTFEKSGIVSLINYKVGDKVPKGALITSLSSGDSYGRVREAEAALMAQQAELERLRSGATPAEIALKTQNLESARADYENVKIQVSDAVKSADLNIKNVISYSLSSLFNKSNSGYIMTFTTCDQSFQNQIESRRKDFDNIIVTDMESAKNWANMLNNFVGDVNALINLPCSSADSSLDSKRSQASLAKSSVSAIISDLSAKTTLLQNADNAIKRAEKDLALTSEGTDKNKINFQVAQVAAASARLMQARVELAKSSIIAPISGVIGSLDVEIGENINAGKQAARIISADALEIKASISENDIVKLSLGNTATVTLDAYPQEEFAATLRIIEPAATTVSGVPRYGITLLMKDEASKIKVGMTANAFIATKSASDVLIVGAEYVKIKGASGTVLRELADKKSREEVVVKTGIRDNKGNIEIVSGLNEGDTLIKNK